MSKARVSPQLSFFHAEVALQQRPLDPEGFEVRFRTTCDALIPDSLFAELYSDNGRPAISPSALTRMLLLQLRHGCGDQAAVENLCYDLRWQYMCNLAADQTKIHYSTLSYHRLRLLFGTIDREKINALQAQGITLKESPARQVFDALLAAAVETGILDPQAAQGIDSTAILGAAAVQDSYRLLFQGLRAVLQVHRQVAPAGAHAALLGQLRRSEYLSERKKPEIDWRDAEARRALLAEYVEDIAAVTAACQGIEHPSLRAALAQLVKLFAQDVEQPEGEAPKLRQGVAPDRQCSVVDPEMRHGRKSSSKRFDGYKGHVTVEPESELITGVAVTPACTHDGNAVETLGAESTASTLVGDQAYAGPEVRAGALAQGVAIITPALPGKPFDKDQFALDEGERRVTCPAGANVPVNKKGTAHFPASACRACPHRAQCNPSGKGRQVTFPRHEGIQRNLRAFARTQRGQALTGRIRPATERVIGHWKRWGVGKGRYLGQAKTGLQALLSAIGHNLDKIGRRRRQWGAPQPGGSPTSGPEARVSGGSMLPDASQRRFWRVICHWYAQLVPYRAQSALQQA